MLWIINFLQSLHHPLWLVIWSGAGRSGVGKGGKLDFPIGLDAYQRKGSTWQLTMSDIEKFHHTGRPSDWPISDTFVKIWKYTFTLIQVTFHLEQRTCGSDGWRGHRWQVCCRCNQSVLEREGLPCQLSFLEFDWVWLISRDLDLVQPCQSLQCYYSLSVLLQVHRNTASQRMIYW